MAHRGDNLNDQFDNDLKVLGTLKANKVLGENVTSGLNPGHSHSSLSASDESPNPALSVNTTGSVGIGTESPGAKLHVVSDTSGTKLSLTGSVTTNANQICLQVNPTYIASDNANIIFRTISSIPVIDPAGFNLSNAVGVRGLNLLPEIIGTGTCAGAIGGYISLRNTGAATVTRAMGFRVDNPENSGGGTITGNTGFIIENMTSGTNNSNLVLGQTTIPTGNFSLYSASTYNSYFAGNVGIGTTSPNEKLEVNGNIRCTNLTASQAVVTDANKNLVSINGLSVTIVTAQLTPVTGSQGSMTFTNGILTAQTPAT